VYTTQRMQNNSFMNNGRPQVSTLYNVHYNMYIIIIIFLFDLNNHTLRSTISLYDKGKLHEH